MKKIVFIPADAANPVMIKDLELTLKEMQALVSGGEGGLVECVELSGQLRGYDLWVNEEGLLIGLPFNRRATGLADQHIVGDAFVTGGPDENGETLGLTDLAAKNLMKLLGSPPTQLENDLAALKRVSSIMTAGAVLKSKVRRAKR